MNEPVSRQPLYHQIKVVLTQRICSDEWLDDRLPSEWDLADELGVSQGTVRKALNELVQEGLLYRIQGRGTFVTQVQSEWGEGLLLTPYLIDESPTPIVREFLGCVRTNVQQDVADVLGLRRLAPVYRVKVLWRMHGLVVAYDEAYLSQERFENLDTRWFKQNPSLSVYQILQSQYGVRVSPKIRQFRCANLDRELALLVGAQTQDTHLMLLRLSVDQEGEPVEWRQRFCIADHLAYTFLAK